MEMGRWSLGHSELSFVHIPFASHAPFACGLLAARKWLPAEKRTRLSEVLNWRVFWTSRVLERIRREVLKQLLHSPVQVLDVLVALVGKHAAGHASPGQVFGLCVEEIDNKRANCVRVQSQEVSVDLDCDN